jgi:hypothetical protein
MSTVPKTRIGRIEFYEAHLGAWGASAASIGLDPEAVAAFAAEVAQARAAHGGALMARDAARAATNQFHNSSAGMAETGASLIAAIRSFAETSGDRSVYALGQLAPPAAPSAAPPPGTPDEFRAMLLRSGAVRLTWKCANPRGIGGTMYEVHRSVGEGGAMAFLGTIGLKSFTDGTLPRGAGAAVYEVIAVRSTRKGNPARFTVNLGVEGGGGAHTALRCVEADVPAKRAA